MVRAEGLRAVQDEVGEDPREKYHGIPRYIRWSQVKRVHGCGGADRSRAQRRRPSGRDLNGECFSSTGDAQSRRLQLWIALAFIRDGRLWIQVFRECIASDRRLREWWFAVSGRSPGIGIRQRDLYENGFCGV